MSFLYEPLTKQQIENVHQATLDVLEKCGAQMLSEEVRDIFKKHGATIEGEIVKIPPALVNKAVGSAPGSFILEGAVPGRGVKIGHNEEPVYGTNGTAPYILENDGTRRDATMEDNIKLFKLFHTCDLMNFATQFVVFPVDKIGWDEAMVDGIYNYYKYTDKPAAISDPTPTFIDMVLEINNVLCGTLDGYKINAAVSPISPLRYEKSALDSVMKMIEIKQVISCVPCSISGMTGPIKPIDNLVLINAENLAMITLVQLLEPGLPCIYNTFTGISDMRYMTFCVGAPESLKMRAMARQMCKYYDIPITIPSGSSTDARELDIQAAAESSVALMTAFSSKPDIAFFGAGGIDSWNSLNFRKVIFDEEIVRYIKVLTSPVEDVRPNTADLIAEVGPNGSYIKTKDTLKYYRKEYYRTNIFNRKNYQEYWEENEHIGQKLDKELQKRLDSYQPLDYTSEQFDQLGKIRDKYLEVIK
ncbi:trimethylamine methyltransferase family protein [Eubacterium limosum]|uniref:trimethylamine methyltransferase family protein n=1 Tax=Eubacterium limosum TaxID=1736 RepID=UPI003722BEE3